MVTDLEGVYAEDPADHAVVEVNRLGRVTSFAYKPDKPASSTVATEVFLYEPDVLVEVLEELHHELSDEAAEGDDDVGDSGLGDFGDLLLPRLVDRGKVYAHRLDGYWRDLGQPHHYLNAHLELLDARGRPVRRRLAGPHPAAAARAGVRRHGRPYRGQPDQLRLRRGRHGRRAALSVRGWWSRRVPRWSRA